MENSQVIYIKKMKQPATRNKQLELIYRSTLSFFAEKASYNFPPMRTEQAE